MRAWFRKQDAGDNETAGRAIAERELARLGAGPALLSTLVGELKANDARELYRWLGEGELSATQFTQAATRRLGSAVRNPPASAGGQAVAAPTATSHAIRPRPRAPASGAAGRRGASPVDIEGVGDLPVTLARCCSPVRPQPIVGYVTLGRGVTVHAAHCAGLLRMQAARPDRVLQVKWTAADDALLPVQLTAVAYDRRGLVRDLSEVLAAQDVAIDALHTVSDRNDGLARTTMQLRVRDLDQMTKLLRLLAAVPGVVSAKRSA